MEEIVGGAANISPRTRNKNPLYIASLIEIERFSRPLFSPSTQNKDKIRRGRLMLWGGEPIADVEEAPESHA